MSNKMNKDNKSTCWKKLKFKEFLTFQRGYDLPVKDMHSGPYPVLGSTSIVGYHDNYKSEPPGVTTGRSGSLGTILYTDNKYWPHNTTLWVRDFKGNNPRFVYYFLKIFSLEKFNSGAGVPTLNRNHLDQYEVKIPTRSVQNKISSVLFQLDDLIENNKKRIEILEEMEQLIYREWFVKFRFPGYKKIKFVDSELGKIPEGWSLNSVSDVVQIYRGISYRSDNLVNKGILFFTINCIYRSGGFKFDGIKYFEGNYKESQLVKPNEIIIGVTDMTQARLIVGSVARIPNNGIEDGLISMDLVRAKPKKGFSSEYVYSLLRYSDFTRTIKEFANGANVLHLNPKHIENFQFILPDENVRNRFLEVISPMYQLMDNLVQTNLLLATKRDLLLPKLMSGEIDVSKLGIKSYNT